MWRARLTQLMQRVYRGTQTEQLAWRAMVPLQWHVFGVLVLYFLVVVPVARFDSSWQLAGRLAGANPAAPFVAVAFFGVIAATYVLRFRSARDTRLEHALRHAAVASIILIPAVVAALNQREAGGMLAYAVAMFALPVLVYVRPLVLLLWLSGAATLVVTAATLWQTDPGVQSSVVANTVGATSFAALLYVLVDRFRVRAHAREQKMRAMGRLKDTIFRAIDHDLKTPMLRVREVSRALADNGDVGPQEAAALVQRLDRSTKEVFHVIDNLTAVAAPGLPEAGSNGEMCDVDGTVDAVIGFASQDAAEKGMTVRKVAGDSDVVAACPQDTVVAILRNLLGNAVKFSQPGGEVRVVVDLTTDAVLIAVEDDGVGVPPAVLTRIENGEGVRGSHGTAGEVGSGMGLLVARTLASTVGADVTLRNRPAGGVTALLTLGRYRPL